MLGSEAYRNSKRSVFDWLGVTNGSTSADSGITADILSSLVVLKQEAMVVCVLWPVGHLHSEV